MESGVEAGHLGKLRRALRNGLERRKVVRLVQRGERCQLGKLGDHLRIYPDRGAVFHTPVNDPVSDGRHRCSPDQAGGRRDDLAGRGAMVEAVRRPALFGHDGAFAVHHIEAGSHAELFHLAAEEQACGGVAAIERELDAGGTGIDHGEAGFGFAGGFRHGIAVLARLAATSRLAMAQDASRVSSSSARLVRMIGTRAPSTIPAPSAAARSARRLASMLPASRSGTIRMSARPPTGELIFLTATASGLMALSSASGPSSMPPVIWPRSAILHRAAASIVEGTLGLTVSMALRMATRGSWTPSACDRPKAIWMMSTFSSRLGAMFTAASVMIMSLAWPGTSLMKQWLMRWAVRRPVSRATTAAINSSVCRLPFIRAWALPARTSATALAAASWLCSASTMS